MVNGCRTTWALPFPQVYPVHAFPLKNNLPLLAALLYAPVPGRKSLVHRSRFSARLLRRELFCSLSMRIVLSHLIGNCLFPVDELMVSESFWPVIEPVV